MVDLVIQDFGGVHNKDLGKTSAQSKQSVRDREWYSRNAEYKKQKAKEHYYANREQKIAYAKAYRAANPGKHVDMNRKKLYGVSTKQVEDMLAAQGGVCAICGLLLNGASKNTTPHIDHRHSDGRVRGVLCSKCNISLGHLEKAGFLEAALKYLEGA